MNLDFIEEHSAEIENVITIFENNYTIEISANDIVSIRTKNDYIFIRNSNKKGFITKDNKFLIKPTYDDIISVSISTQTFVFVKNDTSNSKLLGLANFCEEVILQPIYEDIRYIDAKHFIVRRDGLYAIIDNTGNEIIQYGKYDYIDNFVHGLSRVKKGNKWGIINKYGYEFLSPKFDEIWKLKDEMSTTKVIFHGEEFYLRIDKCPTGIRGTMEDYMRMSEIQILFKYKNQKYKKVEYPEIDVYDLEEERWRKIEEERKEREWKEAVESMTLDAFEGDEELYNDWQNS